MMSNRQVAMADVILVNKIDLVSEEDKTKVLSLIRYVSIE
jgi:G3E family GTPase